MKRITIGLLMILFFFVAVNSASAFGNIAGSLYYKDFIENGKYTRVNLLIYAHKFPVLTKTDKYRREQTQNILDAAYQVMTFFGWKFSPEKNAVDYPEINIRLRLEADVSRRHEVFYRYMYFLWPNDWKAKQKLRGDKSLEEFCSEAIRKYEAELKRRYFFE